MGQHGKKGSTKPATKLQSPQGKLGKRTKPRGLNLLGMRFERLLVLEEAGRSKWGDVQWLCSCHPEFGGCGGTTITTSACLRRGDTKSCGCWQRDHAGLSRRKNLTYQGKTQSMNAWAKELGIDWTTLANRIKKGYPEAKIFSAPGRKSS